MTAPVAHRKGYHAVPLPPGARPRGKRYGAPRLAGFKNSATVTHFRLKVDELRGTFKNPKMEIANVSHDLLTLKSK